MNIRWEEYGGIKVGNFCNNCDRWNESLVNRFEEM